MAPIAGTVIGGLWFGLPEEGFKVGVKVAEVVDSAIKTLSDVFDFIGAHFGPPNCNGEVFNFTLEYKPGELARALNQPASREITGPQAQERCGGAPRSKVNFKVVQQPAFGFFGNNP